MTTDQLVEFMERLVARTRDGTVRWQAEGPASFLLALPSGSVRIRSIDGDGVWPFELSIFDQNGVNIESLQTETAPHGTSGRAVLSTTGNDMLKSLYDAARDNGLNIDAVVQGILADVESGKTEPPPQSPSKPRPEASDDDIPF